MEAVAKFVLAVRPLRTLVQDYARKRHMGRVADVGFDMGMEQLRFPAGRDNAEAVVLDDKTEVDELYWEAAKKNVQDPSITYPEYYTRDYHAYHRRPCYGRGGL